MENKEEIKRIDGKYYLVRELETEGDPVRIDGEKLQPINSIDDDDCQHCCLYDTYNCGEPCVGGFFVRVLPENGEEKDAEKLSNVEITGKNLKPEKEETTMERKIGEVFEDNGEWYQCVEQPEDYIGDVCKICNFSGIGNCELDRCSGTYRSDKKSVIFKKLEKVGETYTSVSPSGRTICFQRYRTYIKPLINTEVVGWTTGNLNFIDIEIKQNEDMEKTNSELSNIEKIGENLKPFSIEAAKAGKPVCTRDGRKARIICFDAKGDKPIIALIEMGVAETPNNYPIDGKAISTKETSCDLMMLPVKKEGWVNVYEGGLLDVKSYKTKEEALAIASHKNYVDTVKIEWEE